MNRKPASGRKDLAVAAPCTIFSPEALALVSGGPRVRRELLDDALGLVDTEGARAADEVERAKNKIASSLVLSGEEPLGRMRTIGGQWIYNKKYRSLETDMATLMGVTPASLRELMDDYPFDPMTIVSLGPGSAAPAK